MPTISVDPAGSTDTVQTVSRQVATGSGTVAAASVTAARSGSLATTGADYGLLVLAGVLVLLGQAVRLLVRRREPTREAGIRSVD
ncbi:hypothetical protein D3C74_456610 [compost metagenome]